MPSKQLSPKRPVHEAPVQEFFCFANGAFVPEREATISILDHGLLYGDGVFDTVVAWNGSVFRLDEHIARLFRSMKAVAMEPPFTHQELRDLTCEAVRINGLQSAYVKWIVSRGSNNTPLMDPKGCVPHLIIIVRPYIERYPEGQAANGIHLKTAAVRRTPSQSLDGRVKSLNYLNLIMAKIEAKAAQADEALLLDVFGNVCEAPGYNVFVFCEGVLHTPVRDVLLGITRASVIEIAQQQGIKVLEDDITLAQAYTADEVFLTSTAGGLIPVSRIDGRQIGDGRPGTLFSNFSTIYRNKLGDPEWGVPIVQK